MFIDQRSVTPDSAYRGVVEVVMIPPFADALLRVSFDGQPVAAALRRPYRISLDLGPAAVEHTIEIAASSADGKRRDQSTLVINPGSRPLGIKVRPAGDRAFEALVSIPRGEEASRVEFYDEHGLVTRLQTPPWRIALPARSSGAVLTGTVTTKAGAEATHVYVETGEIHAASYDVRTVQLMVSITDKSGARYGDLRHGQLEILDKGTRAKILEVGRADQLPISLALLIDASASITPEIEKIRRSATSFARNLLRPQDRCAVFAIRTVPRREQPLTSSIAQVEQALRGLNPSGRTAIYDGIRTALRELSEEEGRKAIVILSDGEDTSSVSTYEDALQMAKLAGVPVYIIAFNDTTDDYASHRDRLQFLATETGGFLTTATSKELAARYKQIERDLREQYAVRYQITDSAKPNEWRDVKVRVKTPDVIARTISGYFTP